MVIAFQVLLTLATLSMQFWGFDHCSAKLKYSFKVDLSTTLCLRFNHLKALSPQL